MTTMRKNIMEAVTCDTPRSQEVNEEDYYDYEDYHTKYDSTIIRTIFTSMSITINVIVIVVTVVII